MITTSASYWIALATTLSAIGSGWQMVSALLQGVASMDRFLGAKNSLHREQRAHIRATVPRWRILQRQRKVKALDREMNDVLTPDELRLDREYDRQATGWALIMMGAIVACWVSWTQAHP
jgi:hypothetical protein